MSKYDVAIIGSGPGGYVAAIRCAQLGMKTAIIEKYATLGGTCLNVGCIPSKALLASSHHYEEATKHFEEHGIEIPGEIKVNLEKMIGRKQSVVDQTTGGIDFLMKKNNIDVFEGLGSFKDATHIKIEGKDAQEIEAKNIIIATGSKPGNLPFISLDKERVITSTEALKLKEIPKHMIVIGGGVIGLELGQVYRRLGAEVTVIEYMDRILPTMDAGLSKELNKVFKKAKFKFFGILASKMPNPWASSCIRKALEKFAIFSISLIFALSPSILKMLSVTIRPWPLCFSAFFARESILLCK